MTVCRNTKVLFILLLTPFRPMDLSIYISWFSQFLVFKVSFFFLLYFAGKFLQGNNVELDQTPRSTTPTLGFNCLPMSPERVENKLHYYR